MNNVTKKVIQIVAKQFQKKETEITLKNNFSNDFEADSLDFVELIMLIEDEFNINLIDMDIQNIKTVKNLIACVEKSIK